MTRDEETSADALEDKIVHIQNFGKLRGNRSKTMLKFCIAHQFFRSFDRRRLAFDVSKDLCDLRDVTAHVGFQVRDLVVSLLKRHPLVEFNVLLDMKLSSEVLHAYVVHIQISVSRDGSDAIKDVLRVLCPREGLHRDVGVGEYTPHGFRDCCHKLAGTLKCDGACKSYSEVGEVAVACSADPHAVDFQYSVYPGDCIVNLGAHTGGSRIEQRVDRTTR